MAMSCRVVQIPRADANPGSHTVAQTCGTRGLRYVRGTEGLQWSVSKCGVRVQQTGGWACHCVELREITGPSSLEVWVYRADGLPKANVRVEFHWPAGVDIRYTEDTGKAGFGYGPGSWIYDPAVGGPH